MKASRKSRPTKTKITPEKTLAFNVQDFLDSAGVARTIVEFNKKDTIFSQGDACNSVMYIQKGGVKLSVVSASGKEAVVAILGPGDFLGEGGLAGQPLRMATATAVTPTSVLAIDGPRSPCRTCTLRPIYHLYVAAEHTDRRGLDRSAFQLQRKTSGPHAAFARPLRQRDEVPKGHP
jgi:hypothetical protein